MGSTRQHFPTLLFVAMFSRHPSSLEWARERLRATHGPELLSSPLFDFVETGFYASTMGADLKKQLLVYERDFDPADLPDYKLQTNAWEQEYRELHALPEERPLNIDPGYLSEAKLVLATTKDRDHRIYLRSGIYAEVTLYYLRSGWQTSRWTYPDYCRADYHQFLSKARRLLRQRWQKE